MHHHRFIIVPLLAATALLAAGCAATDATDPQPQFAAEGPPPDFTLAFTTLKQSTRRNVATLPRDDRPMRFVIETDWVLRGFAGPSLSDQSFPRETRQLNEAEITSIWSDLRDADLLNPAHPAIAGAPPTLDDVDKSLWVITITADGERRMLVLGPDEQDIARPLRDRLADLAWMAR